MSTVFCSFDSYEVFGRLLLVGLTIKLKKLTKTGNDGLADNRQTALQRPSDAATKLWHCS